MYTIDIIWGIPVGSPGPGRGLQHALCRTVVLQCQPISPEYNFAKLTPHIDPRGLATSPPPQSLSAKVGGDIRYPHGFCRGTGCSIDSPHSMQVAPGRQIHNQEGGVWGTSSPTGPLVDLFRRVPCHTSPHNCTLRLEPPKVHSETISNVLDHAVRFFSCKF